MSGARLRSSIHAQLGRRGAVGGRFVDWMRLLPHNPAMAVRTEYMNVRGRTGGRGGRPWLIVPKYLFVAIFVGGLVSLLVLAFLQPEPTRLEEWRRREVLLSHSYVRVI